MDLGSTVNNTLKERETIDNSKETNPKTVCLRQFAKPSTYTPMEGYGNCVICTSDEKNKECRGYYPIKMWTMIVPYY